MPLLRGRDLTREGLPPPSPLSPRGASDPNPGLPETSNQTTGWGVGTTGAAVTPPLGYQWFSKSPRKSNSSVGVPWGAVWILPSSRWRITDPPKSDTEEVVEETTGTSLFRWSTPVGSHRYRKWLNSICKFRWVSLLELGFGVMTTWLAEIEEMFLSIRVIVRVTITRLPESKDGKIDLSNVGDCNE